MELDRREMITLIGSVSSSLSLPVSLVSVSSADEESSANTSVGNDSVLRTSFVPAMESGKIQEIRDGEEVQRVEIEDRKTWTMHARSLTSTVGIDIPLLSRFTPYKVYIDPPYWTISYTDKDGYILDLYHSKHSGEMKASVFEISSKDTTRIESDDFDSLVYDTRQLIQEVIYSD